MKNSILITGANGFVGLSLLKKTISRGYNVKCSTRKINSLMSEVQTFVMGEMIHSTDWMLALKSINVIIHLAARVHVMHEIADDPLAEFRYVNVEGTLNLARQAATAGVRRFVFVSSVKVNGESTVLDKPFSPDDYPDPRDPYGISKREAEDGLFAISRETGMEVVIIRPTLVYGPGVKANFYTMMRWLHKGVPLPFGAVQNKRSLVALDNLVSFIVHCLDHPKAANEIFLISDGEDVSTTELLQKMANAFGKKALLLPIPVELMKLFANILGKGDVAQRLFGSLQVDSSKARDLLGWRPVTTMDEQLKKTADAFLKDAKTLKERS
ncbi:MAG: SDR family oxidoreductase [Deltaproteobacteria bacterium]|jgi:nucleoside-diphosphate-sugar epimerase|nr:SDR family oxidoreductase [Deltaproteobacteria bacterium]